MGRLDRALEVFNIMLLHGVLPNTITFNVIIDGYCKEGHLEEAFKLMDEMQHLGIFLNSYNYNAVIDRLCRERKS